MEDEIKTIIEHINKNNSYTLTASSKQYFNAIRRLKAEEIIVEKRDRTYIFTKLGYHIAEIGGYEKYKEEILEEKKRKHFIDQATINSSNATVDAAKSAKKSTYISLIALLISAISSFYQFNEGRNKDLLIATLIKKIEQVEKKQKAFVKDQETKKISSDSLNKPNIKKGLSEVSKK